MIRFEQVSKRFRLKAGEKVILHDLTMTLPRGRSLALLGRNGAGKSTLLEMIAGSIKPDRGRIVRDARVSFPLGFAGSFNKEMTGRQNLRFVARIYGVDVEALTDYVAEFAELGQFLDQPLRVYSSGMKARLAFGVSMGIRFDVYLVDELTAVGDQAFKDKSRAVFKERLKDSDVIMVSHSMNQLRQYCDCGLVLENGRMEVYDDLEDAIEAHLSNMEPGAAAAARQAERKGPRGRRVARRRLTA